MLLRPRHWVKNAVVFAAIFFSGRLLDTGSWLATMAAFASFCLLASGVYAWNDMWDADADREHPAKCARPVASGRVSPAQALALAIVLEIAGLVVARSLGWWFVSCAAGYVALNAAYSRLLKYEPVLDVVAISVGFVLRAVGGALAIGANASVWLLICTFCLSMFLGFGKRRAELVALKTRASRARQVNSVYTLDNLDHMLATSGTLAVVSYLGYTTNAAARLASDLIVYSFVFVLYAIFRLYLRLQDGTSQDPVELLLHDRSLIATFLLWALSCGVAIYVV